MQVMVTLMDSHSDDDDDDGGGLMAETKMLVSTKRQLRKRAEMRRGATDVSNWSFHLWNAAESM